MSREICPVLPNLGAEEGVDWSAKAASERMQVAASLFSHLFSRTAQLRRPDASPAAPWISQTCESIWPDVLGPAPDSPVFAWMERPGHATAWLNTAGLEIAVPKALGLPLAGPRADVAARVHDKAFAVTTARELGLVADSIGPLCEILDPADFAQPDALLDRLAEALRHWPDWLEGRFTLKPRFGTSGRGRVAGRQTLDRDVVRGSFARFAERGGAIFEPWLSRRMDCSVTLFVPPATESEALPTILGSLEMLANASGVFRGHCGEIDSRGRIHSGSTEDEGLRVAAVQVAERARGLGFFGPCGVDSFSHFEPGTPSDRECWRGCVEFNARATMGLVTIGLARRAMPIVRDPIGLEPGVRRAFAMTFLEAEADSKRERLVAASGPGTLILDLSSGVSDPADTSGAKNAKNSPLPILVFAPDRNRLRLALREVLGC
jgi:hypothetical protein